MAQSVADREERLSTSSLSASLKDTLVAELAPVHLWIEDESAQHRGHPGAAGGARHFRVCIVSTCFEGQPLLERHRLVYRALSAHLGREVHALALRTSSPAEWAGNEGVPCTCLVCADPEPNLGLSAKSH